MDSEFFKISGEAIGAIATVIGFFIYYSATRERILIFKFVSDALWFLNLLFLGGYTGAILNLIGMCRETVFYNRGKRAFADCPIWLPLFLIVTAISPIHSLVSGNEGLYALLPAVGSMLAVIAFYQKKPSHTRCIGFFSQLLWLIYAIFILNYSSIVCNSVMIVSAIVGSLRELWRGRKSAARERETA